MNQPRLLLCTDMDRTIIPNGFQSEDAHARKQFVSFCSQPEIILVYVTGRHEALVKQAIKNYKLPMPAYAITDVGTKIYRIEGAQWQELSSWDEEIKKDWNGKKHDDLKALFGDLSDLKLQELSKQNTHKLSYYVSLHLSQKNLLSLMSQRLEEIGVKASLVWSIDEPKGIGLLDVLPRNATKVHAIDFLYQHLGYALDEVMFAGDSGNDLPVLASNILSVLVANAADEIKEDALRLAKNQNNLQSLYLATGKNTGTNTSTNTSTNGNYSAGVLEGVYHFFPVFRPLLKQTGFCYE